MKNRLFSQGTLPAVALFLAVSVARAATITYNVDESCSQGPNGSAVDFTAANAAHVTYGSTGLILYASNPTYADSQATVSATDPLTFKQDGYATLNTLPAELVVAKTLKQNVVIKAGYAGGNAPDRSNTHFYGVAGTENGVLKKADMLSLTFKQASTTGYRIAILTRPVGPNGNAVSGVTLTSGSSSATAVPFDETNQSTTNALAFYSFDVKNIKAGDVVTLTLSQPTSEANLLYSGLTVDALSASADSAKSPSTKH